MRRHRLVSGIKRFGFHLGLSIVTASGALWSNYLVLAHFP
jgi:hypothetical protein